jgi:superfamily I DNA and/or RNA helicase
MSMPEGLLAASTLHGAGQMIVVGDHRQMPPIITHGWADVQGSLERWKPHRSLFEWLLDELKVRDQRDLCVALDQSFRLHRDQASFLQDAIYRQDNINFHSVRTELLPAHTFADPLINAALRADVPMAVVEHGERASRQSNPFEADLVADLVQACVRDLQVDAHDGIGVVVPHRAQKAALRDRLPALARADSIDTVERFQGGERDVIIMACTASDPEYILLEAEFLMDPQRLNVALSRARKKLIVLAASSVFGALPFDLQLFERAALWKRLRAHVAPDLLWHGERGGHQVQVMGPTVNEGDIT